MIVMKRLKGCFIMVFLLETSYYRLLIFKVNEEIIVLYYVYVSYKYWLMGVNLEFII